jgi:hypothetical protein
MWGAGPPGSPAGFSHRLRCSAGRGALLNGVDGVHNQLRHFLRVGDQREMARIDPNRRRPHAFGHEPLKLGRDRAILL